MTSSVNRPFRKHFATLPRDVQERAKKKFALWSENPRHPSRHFKKVSAQEPLWSVRVSDAYRALGLKDEDHIEWFWIGLHDEYDRILADF